MAPTTSPIGSGSASAHQRLRARSSSGASAGLGAATRAAWTRPRAPIESQNGSIVPPVA